MTHEERVRYIAECFHEVYEQVARDQGWATQEASRVSFDELPESNRQTMLGTVDTLLDEGVIR